MKYRTTIVIESDVDPRSEGWRLMDFAGAEERREADVLTRSTVTMTTDDSDCIRTLSQDSDELTELEEQLAKLMLLCCPSDEFRDKLIELYRSQYLEEDETVRRWLEVMSSFNSEIEFEFELIKKRRGPHGR